ncbi:hypothetical protein FSOLCH5_005515 [Fusarium solani]
MPGPPTVIEIPDDSDSEAPRVSVGEWKRRLFESLSNIQQIGGIATFKRYPSFINPGLKIEGNPIVPLPLNEQAAQDIKSHCRQAPTGNAWELDQAQFQLTNPAWPGFLQIVAGDVANTLDIGGVSSVPRHLMLYGPGPIPRQDSPRENTTDIIGTLVIFLPSEHQGANVNLSIETMSFCFSPASSSALDVSAISWLQGVKCEVDDLTSGYRLAITFSAKKEILGFSQYNLELREPDSDDLEDNPEWACEEGEYSRRINDTAALIVPREHIVNLIDFRKRVGYYGGTVFCQEAVENVLNILTADMERFPDDPKPRQALLDTMTRLSGAGEMLRAMAVERILELSLESGDTALYNKTLAVTSFATNLDSMHVAKLLEQHLAKEYLNKQDDVNWNDWLGPLTERSFQDFRQSCASLKFSIENMALAQSFDAWVLGVSDLKMETEQKWDSFDCSLALDWIKERSEKPDWILNRSVGSRVCSDQS